MRKRLPSPNRRPISEACIIAFGLGILLAFFLSPQALSLIEAVLIIALGIMLFTK